MKMYRLFFRLYLFFLICSFQITKTHAQNDPAVKKVIKVGVYENAPKIFTNGKGDPDGIFVDLVEYIAEKENLQIVYVHKDWSSLMEALKSGELDLLPDVAFSNARDSLFNFNSVPVLSSWLEIYTTPGNEIESVLQLNNKKVGVLEGSVQEEFLLERLKSDLAINYDIITFSTYKESVASLKNAKVDALLATRFFYFSSLYENENIEATGVMLRPTNLYFAFSKYVDPGLIRTFDKNLSNLKNDSGSVYYEILNSWFNSEEDKTLLKYLKWVILGLLAALLLVFGFSFLLRYEVKQKTRELEVRNAELLKAKEKAEESERLKTAFLQNMSHEIRTPMNGILGFMHLMKEEKLDEKTRKKYIDIVSKSGQRLLTTINNIVEFSKIRSKIIEVKPVRVDVSRVMKYHYDFFRQVAEEKGIVLKIREQISGDDAIMETDRNILNGLLTNLINNAIKFTSQGQVSFGNYLADDHLVFYVKDSGQGISEERLESVFNPFVQGTQEISRPYEGSGLGLSIVREYIELIGGKVWVESEINTGSDFYFSIPYKRMTRPVRKPDSDKVYTFSNKRILVAEDDNISYLLLSKILKSMGLEVLRAKNGNEVVAMARDEAEIGLILMDIKMPEKSGLEATEIIRKFNDDIPIIAQSAFAKDGYKEVALKLGCNDYINKPIEKKELVQILSRYFEPVTDYLN